MKPKFLTRTLPLCITLSISLLTPGAQAATIPEPAPLETAVYAVEPRFSYISRIASGMTISEKGYASCTGSYTMYKDMDGTITLILQRFENGRWTDYKETSKDYTGDGVKMFQYGWDVPSGYRYRAHTIVEIKDANGDIVETIAADSPVKEY